MEIRTIFKKMFSLPLLVLVVKILMNVDGVSAENSYIVTFPRIINKDFNIPISVQILKPVGQVRITASIDNNRNEGSAMEEVGKLPPGQSVGRQFITLDLDVPPFSSHGDDRKKEEFTLTVTGSGGVTFREERKVRMTFSEPTLDILLDKTRYRPGDTVNFLVYGQYPDGSIVRSPYYIHIKDGRGNRIAQYPNVKDANGIYNGKIVIPENEDLFDWTLTAEQEERKSSKQIRISDLAPPMFSVDLSAPNNLASDFQNLDVKIDTRYPDGTPVKGKVRLTVSSYNTGTLKREIPVQGNDIISIPKSELIEGLGKRSLDYTSLKINADVIEDVTGESVMNDIRTYVESPYNYIDISFDHAGNAVFKPGIPFVTSVKASKSDKSPLTNLESRMNITASSTTSYSGGMTPFDSQLYDIPMDGIIRLAYTIPKDAKRANLLARYKKTTRSLYMRRAKSKSDNFLKLRLPSTVSTDTLPSVFNAEATEPVDNLFIMIFDDEKLVYNDVISMGGKTKTAVTLPETKKAESSLSLMGYYVRPDGEVVADLIEVARGEPTQEKVSLSLDRMEASPGSTMTLSVATPNSSSLVLVHGRDKRLSSMGDDNRFKMSSGGGNNEDDLRDKFPFDAEDAFQKANLFYLSDANIFKYVPKSLCRPPPVEKEPVLILYAKYGLKTSRYQPLITYPNLSALMMEANVRSLGRETWFSDTLITQNGTRVSTDRSYRVPLTYTTWEVSAMSLDKTKQTPSKAELKVTSPFHIRLQLPNSAKAMEPTMLAATVINNLPYDAEVLVALDKNDGWMNLIPTDRNGKTVNQKVSSKVARLLKIKRSSLGIALFPILPLDNTNLQVRISAKTQKNDEDAVEATLRVDPPGKQVMKTWQRLVNQKEGESNNDVIDTRDPEIMGYNTTRLIITARGDVIGPSINEVANKVPGLYGARTDSADTETVVKTIGPRLLLSKYYEAMRMKNYGRDNYTEDHERLLSMQLPDGSFSSFGPLDIRGSTWMTATVLKILKDLYSFGITVDDTAITKATNWLAEQQKADGSFEENGRLVEINLQGGSGEGPVELTAYVTGILVDTPCLDCTQTMTNRAKVYLEKEADAATSAHQLAILANTLQLLKSIKVPGLLERLERMATKKDNMKYWDNVDTPDSVWYPVEEKIDPIDLETASYVLSTHRNAGKLKAALPVLRWIISQQRNGFREISDISTETLLQLLTLYSGIGQDIDTSMMNLDIRVSSQTPGQPFTHNFRITPENTLLLQSVQVPKEVKEIQLTSRGPGLALVEVEHYHSEPQDPHTTLDVALANETAMSYTVVICPRLFVPTIGDNWARLEVEIPEGLTPFIDKNNWKVRSSAYNRHEIADGRIYIYLQSPDRRDSCIPVRFFLGTKTRHIPAKQPSRVMLYTKNNKNKKITKFFQSAIGKMNTLCQMRCGPNCIC